MVAGFTEARRNRITVVVAAFAACLILLTTVVLNSTVFTLERAVTDFGLGVMSLLLVGLTVFLSGGMLSGEIEKRTVFLIMSRPISRRGFVLGRYLGTALTLTVLLAVMVVLYLSQLFFFEVPLTSAIPAAIIGLWVELLLIAAIGFFFSSFTSRVVSAISVVGLYFLGHAAPDVYHLSQYAKSEAVRLAAGVLYRVIPNLDALDFRSEAAWGSAVSASEVALASVTAAGWTLVFLAGAALAFSRRDFR
jgi:ABC-type transport system involved in multi-copper enzyme maturation permease subunit